jgi:hypothetical protein
MKEKKPARFGPFTRVKQTTNMLHNRQQHNRTDTEMENQKAKNNLLPCRKRSENQKLFLFTFRVEHPPHVAQTGD